MHALGGHLADGSSVHALRPAYALYRHHSRLAEHLHTQQRRRECGRAASTSTSQLSSLEQLVAGAQLLQDVRQHAPASEQLQNLASLSDSPALPLEG
jgi:hypothetical protein